MSEQERAIVRACLDQVLLGMSEARDVASWWTSVSESNRQAWKEFGAFVNCAHVALKFPAPLIPSSNN
jgi:hypothetical protein